MGAGIRSPKMHGAAVASGAAGEPGHVLVPSRTFRPTFLFTFLLICHKRLQDLQDLCASLLKELLTFRWSNRALDALSLDIAAFICAINWNVDMFRCSPSTTTLLHGLHMLAV